MKMGNVYILIFFSIVFAYSCSDLESVEKKKYAGSYILSTQNGTEYEMQLVVGENDALFGFYELRSESTSLREVIYPEHLSRDSLRLRTRFGGHFLEVSRENGEYRGVADLIGDTVQVTLEKKSPEPGSELKKKARIEEVKMGLVRPQFPTFKEDGRFYMIGKPSMDQYDVSNIYFIQHSRENTDSHTVVAFDQERYSFTAIGLSPDETTLVASGIIMSEDHTTGSDIFLIHLKNPTEIERIERLEGDINTESFEIFPSFTPGGDILYSSGGNPAGNIAMERADLFMARKSAEGYMPVLIGPELNTDLGDASPYMDPEGRFLIFYRKSPGGDYINYISERTDDGWTSPEKITGVMENVSAYGLRIDRQGEYLYFTSFFQGPGKLFRIHTGDIPELNPFFNQ